ncbi:MAG: DUF4388 domain-containing protein [Myxococcales bacterium]|nr:DUF4388 domain-containing protein [Myxococcales bacterium]MDH3483472.1 DUF4388 domain-containing protein [Myxococcales bacterium]
MVAEAVFQGEIPAEGVADLLGGLEQIGTTGVLAFHSTSGSGAIRLVHGQIAEPELNGDEERALETLLALRDGEFAVYPKLPHLPVSRGTDTTRRGSIAVHPPSELMRYCEGAGLTGRLLLEHRGRLAIGYYEKGQLEDVSIDGGTAADFVQALEWTEGTFRVDAVPPPRETLPPSLQDKTPAHLTSPTELARAGADRPDGTPVSGLRPRVERDEDATIRIIRRPETEDLDEPPELWSTLEYSPSFPRESATTTPVKSKDDGRSIGFWRTLGWVGAVLVVVLGCLWVLAALPPLE